MKKVCLTLALAAMFGFAHGQEPWSLERCIRHAQEANLNIQQAQLTVKNAQLTENQARANRLPSLNGSISAGEQFGKTVDPTTNSFLNTSIGFNQIRLSTNWILYSGGEIRNGIKQAGWDKQAAQADAEQMTANMSLQVAATYLNILLSEEQLAIAKRRVDLSREQLSNTKKLIRVGTVPAADSLNLIAQMASNEQQVVVAQNTVDLAYLNLKQLLLLEPDYNLAIEHPKNLPIPTDAKPEAFSLKPIFNTALGTQATIRAGEMRQKSAEIGVRLAEGGYYPRLSFFGSLSTNYSSEAYDYLNGTVVSQGYAKPQVIRVNGTDVTVEFPKTEYAYSKLGYGTQLNQNFGQTVGLSLDIPIYENSRTTIAVQRAKLAIQSTQIQNQQTRNQLKTDIQTAIANSRAAKLQLEASQKTFDAMKKAFENMQRRHDLGAVNALELTTARSNLDNSENNLVVARYDYLFKLKIIDFYNGLKLDL